MRMARWTSLALLPLAFAATACSIDITGIGGSDPTNLSYTLIPSGNPTQPMGVLLTWDAPTSRHTTTFAVYGREGTAGSWYLVGITTSTSFHDAGDPQSQYYVSARDEDDYEFGRSRIVTITAADRLPAPTGLAATAVLNGVQLRWNANARTYGGSTFGSYRVYSARYSSSTQTCLRDDWTLEGTTISEQFLVAGLNAGVYRCFAVSAVTRDGVESSWSEAILEAAR